MPPKAKITPDKIVEAAFCIARECGAEQINARRISQRLGCSTQPVLWHFKSIAEIRRAAYERANAFQTEALMKPRTGDALRDLGLNYICFAAEEKHLFRFIFQSDEFSGLSLQQLIESEELSPVMTLLEQAVGLSADEARRLFKMLFLFVHGYAAMLANNAMAYDPQEIAEDLRDILHGALFAIRSGTPAQPSEHGPKAQAVKAAPAAPTVEAAPAAPAAPTVRAAPPASDNPKTSNDQTAKP